MPMELDMLEIEMSVVRLPFNADRDEARVQEILSRIKRKFPTVEPQSKLQQVRYLIGRLNHISIFNGVVLRVPGTIEGDAPAQPPAPELDEFRRLAQEAVQLKQQLTETKHNYDIAAAIAHRLQEENKQQYMQRNSLQEEKEEVLENLQETEARLMGLQDQMRADGKKCREKTKELEQAKAQLQTELELLKSTQPTIVAQQQELAGLRQRLASAEKAEQQLRETIEKREQEIRELRERIKQLTQSTRNRQDTVREPWLDL